MCCTVLVTFAGLILKHMLEIYLCSGVSSYGLRVQALKMFIWELFINGSSMHKKASFCMFNDCGNIVMRKKGGVAFCVWAVHFLARCHAISVCTLLLHFPLLCMLEIYLMKPLAFHLISMFLYSFTLKFIYGNEFIIILVYTWRL